MDLGKRAMLYPDAESLCQLLICLINVLLFQLIEINKITIAKEVLLELCSISTIGYKIKT